MDPSQYTILSFPDASDQTGEDTIVFDCLRQYKPEVLVLDLPYERTYSGFMKRTREMGIVTVFLDDFRFLNPGADIYINSSILAEKRIKTSHSLSGCFLGPRYLIFDEQMLDGPDPFHGKQRNVVLTFGGSDPTGLTEKVARELKKEPGQEFISPLSSGRGSKGKTGFNRYFPVSTISVSSPIRKTWSFTFSMPTWSSVQVEEPCTNFSIRKHPFSLSPQHPWKPRRLTVFWTAVLSAAV